MRLGVLFWNIGKRDCGRELAELVDDSNIDLIATSESNSIPTEFVSFPRTRRFLEIKPVVEQTPKIRLFATTSLWEHSHVVFEGPKGRLVVVRVILEKTDLLVAVVHLPSKSNFSTDDQSAIARENAKQLRDTEDRFGHRRTLLLGDFNMNPFDYGIIHSGGFHAVMDRAIAQRGSRTVQAVSYPFFYNPMWGLFGDRTPGPCGTHYFGSGAPGLYFWNMFDQVMIRPELLSNYQDEVAIIDRVGSLPLCDRKQRPSVSDHFPVKIGLNFP